MTAYRPGPLYIEGLSKNLVADLMNHAVARPATMFWEIDSWVYHIAEYLTSLCKPSVVILAPLSHAASTFLLQPLEIGFVLPISAVMEAVILFNGVAEALYRKQRHPSWWKGHSLVIYIK